jgi:serine protease AprX
MFSRRIIIIITILVILSVIFSYLSVLSILVPKANAWAEESIQIEKLHELGYDGSEITIGIIDTGLDSTNQEFDESSFLSWYDPINHLTTPYDDDDHGTHLVGLLVGKGSFQGLFSGVNLQGVAPNAEIICIKAIPMNQYLYGGGNDSLIARGIQFCINYSADIIVLSMGMSPEKVDFTDKTKTTEMINEAVNHGIFIISPAGNDGQNDDGDVCFPATLSSVISVGAVSKSGLISSFSSKGHQYPNTENPNKKPELVAPGQDILSTRINGAYGELSGSSQASIYVAGVIALLLDAYPEYKPGGSLNQNGSAIPLFKETFALTAKKIGSLEGKTVLLSHDDWYGYGLIQAYEVYKILAR